MKLPNFLVLFVDDMGLNQIQLTHTAPGELYGYSGDGGNISTPSVAKLAREGMTFQHWYSAFHYCSPSRASMLTGRYPVRVGIGIPPCDGNGEGCTWNSMSLQVGQKLVCTQLSQAPLRSLARIAVGTPAGLDGSADPTSQERAQVRSLWPKPELLPEGRDASTGFRRYENEGDCGHGSYRVWM